MSRLRVVMVIPSLGGTGGLERVATTLALAIAPSLESLVVCFARRGPYEQTLRDAGIELVRIHRPRPRPDRLARAIAGLIPVVRRNSPDVIHAHNPAAGLAAATARTLARRRASAVVTTFHGLAEERVGLAAWLLAHTSDAVIGVGASSTERLLAAGLPATLATTVDNAVVASASKPRDAIRAELGAQDGELVVNVGRYVPEKDQETLLAALALLAPRRRDLRAVLVGTGPLEQRMRERLRMLGLDGVVELTGPRGDAIDVLAAADVVAISSRSEGLPLVLLEAMSLGRAIATTNVGSITDAVTNEHSALVVPPRDPAALAAAIERLLDDRHLASALGATAQAEAAERFSVESMAARTLEVYESAVAARRGRVA